MSDNKKCKIVQDLFPNYIENLADEETNKFIEEHLRECTECEKVLENMKKEIKTNIKIDKSEANYIKKYSNKMKILKAILLVIFIIFVASTLRKFIIISSLSNKANEYVNSTNYHTKIISYQGSSLNIVDAYYKDGKELVNINNISKENQVEILCYNDSKHTYINNGETKVALLNGQMKFHVTISNYLQSTNKLMGLFYAMTSTVKSTNCNGKDCYYIMNLMSGDILTRKDSGIYIDKETGLVIRDSSSRTTNGEGTVTDTVVDHYYDFNTVSDDIFIEPDISEYEVKENS